MNLAEEQEKLREVLEGMDEQLKSFSDLILSCVDFELDYSLESIRYVELVLKQIQPSSESDNDLLIDAALYIGETLRRQYEGSWDVSTTNDVKYFAQPVVLLQNGKKEFYPFVAIRKFAENPIVGFFESV